MPIIIKLQDIDEAIENLRYKNETTLKARLLRAVRQYYPDDASAESLQSIDTEELVRTIWETGDDRDLLKTKRKNFSSLKSSVNSDLKKLYADGKNPQGIVISHNNVFGISDEAKDKALAGILDVFKEKGIDTQSKISEILSVLSDILSTSISDTEAENTKEEIDRLKNVLGGITGKLGLSLSDIVRRAGTLGGPGAPLSGSGTEPMELPGKDKDLSDYIRGGLSEIDQGLQGLAREIEEASGNAMQTGVIESVRSALKDIVGVLRDSQADAPSRAKKIMASVTHILTDTIDASGDELTGDQAGQLKQIFHEMAKSAGEGPADGEQPAADQVAAPARLAGAEFRSAVSSILGDGSLDPGDQIGKIMAAVNDLVGEALADQGAGLGDEQAAGIKAMMANITGNLGMLTKEALTGPAGAGSLNESAQAALTDIVETLRDPGTDATGKARKIMTAVEGILAEAIETSGALSGDQAGQLQQIFHEMAKGAGETPAGSEQPAADQTAATARLAGGEFMSAVSSILGDGSLDLDEKMGKIMAAVNDLVGEALADPGAGLSDEQAAGIKSMLANITGNLGMLAEEALTGPAGTGGLNESAQAALRAIIETLRDPGTDATGKAQKIMTAVEGILAEAIETSGALSGDQAGQLQQIFHEMAKGAGEGPGDGEEPADQSATPARLAGREFMSAISSILGDGSLDLDEKMGKIMAAVNDLVGEALADPDAGLSDEQAAGIKAMMANITGNLGMLAEEALTGPAGTGGLNESAQAALRAIIETLRNPGTDTTGKAKKIMTAMEGVVADAIETAGGALSGDQAGQLRQIFHELTQGAGEAPSAGKQPEALHTATPEELAGNGLFTTVSSVLGDGELSVGDKIGQIMAAVNSLVGDALAGAGISDDEIAGIKSILATITGNLETLAGAEDSDTADAIRRALQDIVQTLQNTGMDTSSKAKKIMAAVLGMLTGQVDATAALSGEQAGRLRQIIDEMAEGAGVAPAEEQKETGRMPTPARLAGSELLSAVSSILGDGELSAAEKIGKIMAAVSDMIGETLASGGTELSEEEIAGIKDMMANVTDNIEAFAEEAIEGFEIIEEITLPPEGVELPPEGMIESVEAELAQSAENMEGVVGEDDVVDDAGTQFADIVEIIEDISEGVLESAADIEMAEDGMIADQAAVTDFLEDMVDAASAEEAAMIDVEPISLMETEVTSEIAVSPEGVTVPPEGGISSPEGAAEAGAGGAVDNISGSGLEIQSTGGEDGPGGADTGDLLSAAVEAAETSANEQAVSGEIISDELARTELIEELTSPPEAVVEAGADETFEVVEEIISDSPVVDAGAGAAAAQADIVHSGDDIVAITDGESTAADDLEEVLDEAAITDTPPAADGTEITAVENISEQDFVEEIVEDAQGATSGIQVTPANSEIDNDLREKAELLTRLAEAAGALQAMGPDLSGSIYTEEEIRGKAKFLSEEFDRYLSIRDKFYNAHILIKAGDYLVGGAHLAKSVLAEQVVTLPDFYIGKFPVTNALFEIFIEQTGYVTTAEKVGYSLVYFPRMQRSRDPITGAERFTLHNQAYSKRVPGACWHRPLGPDSSLHLKRTHPVVQVSLEDAHAFAAWTGKRLPTEIEWEAAARTAQGLIYPWGNEWQENACNIEATLHGDTTPVDHYVKFANALEVADTLGNVLEWTGDAIGDRETSDTYIAKGASWIAHDEISLTDRHYLEKNAASNILGFRSVAI
ncbi:MAG: SUMF1/EgtB/PvdO family nonheme iron enzyme [Deltaproteobacteria bacterium]